MGELSKVASSTHLTKNNIAGDMRVLLEKNWPRIASVMPKHVSPERMMQLAISTINKNPKLAQCDAASILSCFMTASSLGLEPNDVNGLGQCYIIPYGRQATFIVGYRGLYKLALNSGEIQSITVEAVYDGDEFEYQMGDDAKIIHRPSMSAEHTPESLVCVYCITRFSNGGIQRNVMTKSDIEKRRNASKSGKSGPWSQWYEEMAKKTVIRSASKTWPLSSDKSELIQKAVSADETIPDYRDVFNPVIDGHEVIEATGEVVEDAPEEEQQQQQEQGD